MDSTYRYFNLLNLQVFDLNDEVLGDLGFNGDSNEVPGGGVGISWTHKRMDCTTYSTISCSLAQPCKGLWLTFWVGWFWLEISVLDS